MPLLFPPWPQPLRHGRSYYKCFWDHGGFSESDLHFVFPSFGQKLQWSAIGHIGSYPWAMIHMIANDYRISTWCFWQAHQAITHWNQLHNLKDQASIRWKWWTIVLNQKNLSVPISHQTHWIDEQGIPWSSSQDPSQRMCNHTFGAGSALRRSSIEAVDKRSSGQGNGKAGATPRNKNVDLDSNRF